MYAFNDDKSKAELYPLKLIEVQATINVSGASGSWTYVSMAFDTPSGYTPIGVARKFQNIGGGTGFIDLSEDSVTFFEISDGTSRTVKPTAIVYFVKSDFVET